MTISKTIYLQNKTLRNRENLKSLEISMRKTSISYKIRHVSKPKVFFHVKTFNTNERLSFYHFSLLKKMKNEKLVQVRICDLEPRSFCPNLNDPIMSL
jgi:hypothetical protein